MLKALARKLSANRSLPEADVALLERLPGRLEFFAAGSEISVEGAAPGDFFVVTSGFAYRYKSLDSGRRQIVGFLIPGDSSDLHASLLSAMDHSIVALSDVQLTRASRDAVASMMERPALAQAMLRNGLVEKAQLRYWLTSIGQCSAEQRLAYHLSALLMRLKAIGLARAGEIDLPLTQAQLGEATGLSTVHVNRSLQSLRARGLVGPRAHRIVVRNLEGLRDLSGFGAKDGLTKRMFGPTRQSRDYSPRSGLAK